MSEVRAAVRIRPAVRSGGPPLSIKGQYGQFAFDYVVEEGASQEVTFTECILPQVNNFLQGISSAVLAYGAASTGKSYTLEGGAPTTRNEGAIPRAMHTICQNLAVVPKHRYKLHVTYCALSAGMEAQMVDLLAPGAPTISLKDASAHSALARLVHHQVESYDDIHEVLRQGRMTRAAASSAGTFGGSSGGSNGGSNASRPARAATAAHLMLNIILSGFAASGEQLATCLTFIELAAPESKDMLGYPAAIDSGLARSLSLAYTSLTAVISALRAGGSGTGGGRTGDSPVRGHTHVPWRDSPLTRWLKGCLEVVGSILVIATVAPGPEAAADTLATLSYVNRLRSGPKSDGLIVTATWDASEGNGPSYGASVAQQELQQSLQRAAQAQRERQERERDLQERERERQKMREREQDRFGSPIQLRPAGNLGLAAAPSPSGGRPQSAGRFFSSRPPGSDPPAQSGVQLLQPGDGVRNSPSSMQSQGPQRYPSPSSHPPLQQQHPHPLHQLQLQLQQQLQPLRSLQQQRQQLQAEQLQGREGPLSELLASLQMGGSSQQPGVRADVTQPIARSGVPSGDAGARAAAISNYGRGGRPLESEASGGHAMREVDDNGVQAVLEALSRQIEQLKVDLSAEKRETQRLRTEASTQEAANRAAIDRAEASTSAALGELRGQLEALRTQLDTSEGAKQALLCRVQQLQEQQGTVLDLQAESNMLEAQVRALQESLGAARSGQSTLAAQLADAKSAADSLRQDRDRLQRQNNELSEKLQAQVRILSEETVRLKAQAKTAAEQFELEQVARRNAESALSQLRIQMESSRGSEAGAMQQAASLVSQVKELSNALEAVRSERNRLQEAKWRAEERAEQLSLELDSAMTQRAKVEMESRAAATRADSDLRSAISAAEGLKAELSSARNQMDGLKQELRTAQQAVEDASRRESSAINDMQEMDSLMREIDRDLEMNLNAIWRQLRLERADSLFSVPESSAVTPARRWRPVLQSLLTTFKRINNEVERQSQLLEQARERIAGMEIQVSRSNELATSLAAHQQIKVAQLSELEESHRSIALMDHALSEANRECQRLHRQLEELTATHKAHVADAAAREARLQGQAAERETTLQAQITDKEERLRSAVADHDKRVQALASEFEARLHQQVADRDTRLAAAVIDAEHKIQATAADRESRLVASVAEAEARLHKAVLEADARYQEAVTDRENRLANLMAERDALQRQLASLGALKSEDKQERDVLRLRAHAREQLLNVAWSEVRGIKLACLAGISSPQQSQLGAGPSQSSPVSISSCNLAEDSGLDWDEPVCQEKLLKSLTTIRVQVGKLQAELSGLRAGVGMTEELTGQLAGAKARLAEAQRNADEMAARAAGLEHELREEQHIRATLQQQQQGNDVTVKALQSSLLETQQNINALQEEVAALTKSRDTWRETAAQQESQMREMFADTEARASEVARLRSEAQTSAAEANGATARIRLLESQLQDTQTQLETLNSRLAATDKALADANTRAAGLNGQLVLSESESRLKTQELLSRVQAAEDAERLAKATAKDAMERLEARLREASEQSGKLVADLDVIRSERTEAQLRADDLQRHLMEARARLADMEHVGKQLQKLVSERDALQDQLNSLRNAHIQAADDARNLRRTLDNTQEQLQRVTDEKTRLAAQLEGQRLEAIMNSMAPRTAGRIGALARPHGTAAGDMPQHGPMGSTETQRAVPGSYARAYTNMSFTGMGSFCPPSVNGRPSSPSMPSVVRPASAYAANAMTPYTPTTTTISTPGFESTYKPALGFSGLSASYGGADDPQISRIQIRTSPQSQSAGAPGGMR